MSVDEQTIELAGSPVFYRCAPGPDEPVLYLHGIPTSSDDWISFLERTGGIAPDLIGFGRSGKGGHLDYSVSSSVAFVEQLLGHLGVERVRLVVHDWGAVGGLQFAQRYPDRVSKLVVCNAVPLFGPFAWPRFVHLWRRAGVGELIMGSIPRRLMARTLRKGGDWSDERIASVWDQFDQGTQRAILRLYRDAGERRLEVIGKGLGGLGMPALVVWGQRDPWLTPRLGESYAELLPGATLAQFPGAGHWPWMDDPEVVERVAGFLQPR